MSYDKYLSNQFKDLVINLVKHDTSFNGLPAYIEVYLNKTPKDKATLVLDLGNYIHRTTGLKYQMTPEFRGKGKKTTIRWFMSWDDIEPIIPNINKALGTKDLGRHIPLDFQSLIIQNSSRGVIAA